VDIAAVPEAAPSPGTSSELAKAATEFEAYLLKLLWQEMRKTTDGGGLFGRSSLRGYDTFIDEALTQRAAEAGSFGLATQLLNEWERKA
jgi:Rod binding domain-containing protein